MQNNTRIKVSHTNFRSQQNINPQPQSQQYQTPICSFSNGTSITILLYILTLILGTLNVGIIGYNFGYYKGSYRTSLFHSELTFLTVFSIGFVLNVISLVIKLFTRVRKFKFLICKKIRQNHWFVYIHVNSTNFSIQKNTYEKFVKMIDLFTFTLVTSSIWHFF